MPVKPPSEVPTDAIDDGFRTVSLKLRGKRYVLKELSAAQYQECVDKATTEDPDTKIKMTNDDVLSRLMLDKALIEPDMTVKEVWEQPTTVVFRLNRAVADIHFTPLESDDEAEDEPEADEGEAKG